MLSHASLFAGVGHPLFGNIWLALLLVFAGIAAFLFLVAWGGRWAAATHPERLVVVAEVFEEEEVAECELTPEIVAVIAASVSAALGVRARIASVKLVHHHSASVEALMQQWSLEGRRQIYGSHKVR